MISKLPSPSVIAELSPAVTTAPGTGSPFFASTRSCTLFAGGAGGASCKRLASAERVRTRVFAAATRLRVGRLLARADRR